MTPAGAGARAPFTFHRGALALDFAGTVGSRASDRPVERMSDAAALAQWLHQAGLLESAAVTPSGAEYQYAMDLREAIARVCLALVEDTSPPEAEVQTINRAATDMMRGVPYLDQPGLIPRWRTDTPVRLALGRLAADAIRVIGEERGRLTRCQSPTCGALLLSGNRGEPRRWCSMQACGNRAKVAAFRASRALPKSP